jgi:UDP-glucose 4-epimerase
LLRAVHDGGEFSLFGTDYDTRDGTCLRDFVHVKDLADAHIAAIERIDALGCERINLGTANGYTVREVVDAVRSITENDFAVEETDRRPGDPAKLVASNDRAQKLLDWQPERDLETIIQDAWEWKREHPDGY